MSLFLNLPPNAQITIIILVIVFLLFLFGGANWTRGFSSRINAILRNPRILVVIILAIISFFIISPKWASIIFLIHPVWFNSLAFSHLIFALPVWIINYLRVNPNLSFLNTIIQALFDVLLFILTAGAILLFFFLGFIPGIEDFIDGSFGVYSRSTRILAAILSFFFYIGLFSTIVMYKSFFELKAFKEMIWKAIGIRNTALVKKRLRDLVRANPHNGLFQYLLAKLYDGGERNSKTAIKHYINASIYNTSHPEVNYLNYPIRMKSFVNKLSKGNKKKIEKKGLSFIKAYKDDFFSYSLLAGELLKFGETEKVKQLALKAIELNPYDMYALHTYAITSLTEDNYNEAYNVSDKLINLAVLPKALKSSIYYVRAFSGRFVENGNQNQVEEDFKLSILYYKDDPFLVNVYFERSSFFLEERRFEEALSDIEVVISRNPDFARAFYQKLLIIEELSAENIDEQIQICTRGVETARRVNDRYTLIETLEKRSLLYQELMLYKRSIDDYMELYDLDRDPNDLANAARLHIELKEFDQAEKLYDKAVAEGLEVLYSALANVKLNLKKYDEAIALHQARIKDSNSYDKALVHIELAEIYHIVGDLEKALLEIAKAEAVSPYHDEKISEIKQKISTTG